MSLNEKKEILLFKHNTSVYGIFVENVREVCVVPELMQVPTDSTSSLVGVVSLRGAVLSVFDFGKIFNLESSTKLDQNEKLLIVIENDNQTIGILVDSVLQIVRDYSIKQNTFLPVTVRNSIDCLIETEDSTIAPVILTSVVFNQSLSLNKINQ